MFTNFSSNVNKWLGAVEPDDDATESCVYEEKEGVLTKNESESTVSEVPPNPQTNNDPDVNTTAAGNDTNKITNDSSAASSTLNQIQFDIDEVSTKAMETAKEWGSEFTK